MLHAYAGGDQRAEHDVQSVKRPKLDGGVTPSVCLQSPCLRPSTNKPGAVTLLDRTQYAESVRVVPMK